MSAHLRGATRGLLTVLSALLLCCAPKEDRSKLSRRPVSPALVSGWARLPLDGKAQLAYPDLWLSDAEGVSIPFEVEREGLWQPRKLELSQTLLGRDAKDRPTAEFTLKFPEGWQVRDREHLRVDLVLEGQAPWVCRVEVDRRMRESAFLRLEQESPLHLFDLGNAEGKRGFYIPWEAQSYRVTLVPTQGPAPKITGVSVTASTRPEELQADEVVAPRMERSQASSESWILNLDAPQRIVGADVLLKPPVAPLQPQFAVAAKPPGRTSAPAYDSWVSSEGLLWNLPALSTKATRVSLGPVVTDQLLLTLPEGARLDTVKLLVHRDVLLFPAEAGRNYLLHTGGRVKRAPGSLAALPDSSRAVYAREPLKLGPGEADPQGLPILIQGAERTRPWLPWVTGLAVLLLGFFAWKLLRVRQ
jgi:hypothetical protein